MRLLGEIESSEQTTRLAAWLVTKGIKVKVEPEPSGRGYEVWVKDEDRLEEAKSEYAGFQAHSSDPKYDEAIKEAEAMARREALQRKQLQKKIVKVQGGQLVRRPPLTILLIAICGLVALMTNFGDSYDSLAFRALQFVSIEPPVPSELLAQGRDSLELRLASLQRGELWRAVTPVFIHHRVFHLLFNMMWLYQFGRMIENRYGTLSLGLLVLASAVLSNVAQCTVPIGIGGSAPFLTDDQHLLTLLGGMSGVVYALFGFVWIRSQVDRSSGMYVSQGNVTLLIIWLFFCMTPLSMQLLGINVANWAHGIGILVGMAAGYWPALKR